MDLPDEVQQLGMLNDLEFLLQQVITNCRGLLIVVIRNGDLMLDRTVVLILSQSCFY